MKTDHDFRKFYYAKVALGENCGCAERVIDLHEADRKSGEVTTLPVTPKLPVATRLHRGLARLGLTKRR